MLARAVVHKGIGWSFWDDNLPSTSTQFTCLCVQQTRNRTQTFSFVQLFYLHIRSFQELWLDICRQHKYTHTHIYIHVFWSIFCDTKEVYSWYGKSGDTSVYVHRVLADQKLISRRTTSILHCCICNDIRPYQSDQKQNWICSWTPHQPRIYFIKHALLCCHV